MLEKLTGLIAATYTPIHEDGSVDIKSIPANVDRLIAEGVSGFYVCGSTGEGVSLTVDERKAVAKAYVDATGGRVPVIIQVGHNSLHQARELASHAHEVGADVISATAPSYFKVGSVEGLVDCMAEVAGGAPELPFYYYHIPVLTGVAINMVEFLELAGSRISNLVGLKYTAPDLAEYLACLSLEDGRFDVLWGADEMLLGAWATGARGAVGSTYNIAAPLYQGIIDAFEAGDMVKARKLQHRSVEMIRVLAKHPFHPAMKALHGMLGAPCGHCRLPHPRLTEAQIATLRSALTDLGFFDGDVLKQHSLK
jgi:N-acetylneuraminate lyase